MKLSYSSELKQLGTWMLDQIDASQNGWLDADELKFFDANQSNTMEANEQVGLQHAEHLLASNG